MRVRLQGFGWVTPLGREIPAVWEAVKAGAVPASAVLANPFTGREFPIRQVPAEATADVARLPRLRRSSVISLFGVAAALDAMRMANCDPATERVAIIFAATNGGVIYTRRFFGEVSKTGTQAGSPLLFPETVYNAPASHIAATLGVTGVATTLVNDATAGVEAIATAEEMLDSGACDRCLVVGAEEADWAICEGFATWHLASADAGIVPFAGRGTVFAEGAAALVLGTGGSGPSIERIHRSRRFRTIPDARRQLDEYAGLTAPAEVQISSVSGTPFDEAESGLPAARSRFAPKVSFGEAFAASTLLQTVCAALALGEQAAGSRAFIPVVGFHGQTAALVLRS